MIKLDYKKICDIVAKYMKAVLMAGGEGTRLRPLTLNRPKPLVPVCNKPIMEHILEKLNEAGIKDIVVTLYYLANEIQAYFGSGSEFGVNMQYFVEETPLGTAGSIKNIDHLFNDTFLIMSGDALTDINIMEAVDFHKKVGAIATIVLTRVETPLEYGVVIIDDDGKIIRFLEKPGWGEVFSDTVNTGIYILEPAALEFMEKGKVYDFSKDLFPLLLSNNKPLFGCIKSGYWCDIGNLKQYREVHQDALLGKVKINIPGKEIEKGIWVGETCEISPKAKLSRPSIIGGNCKIKSNSIINDFTIIGDNSILEENCSVTRSLIWNNSYVGKNSVLTGAMVGCNNILEENITLEDGSIVGDNCTIGRGSVIKTQVKIWPDKIIESGAQINMSIIWGQNWPGSLFSALGIKGIGNIEITPEYAARVGAAFGAYLAKGAYVISSRSPQNVARIIKRALVSGLMSVGVNVIDLRATPLPVTRHAVKTSHAKGGVHIRMSPYEPEKVLIEFFDENGINIDTDKERKVENIFFRQDYRRTDANEIGRLEHEARAVETYLHHFNEFIDSKIIRERKFKLVIDYSHGSLSTMLPTVLGGFGCEAVSLNAYMDWNLTPRPSALDAEGLKQLSSIVSSLDADIGILVDGEAEKLSIVDKNGKIIAGERLLAFMLKLIAYEYKNPVVAVQIRSPFLIDKIVKELNGKILKTKSNSRSLMSEAYHNKKVCFGGDIKGGFIFSKFHSAFDAMACFSKILELVAKYKLSIVEINNSIPEIFIETTTIECSWENKGKLMRLLVEKYKKENIELTDGLKLISGSEYWALVRPDPTEPSVHIVVEGKTQNSARQIVEKYKKDIQEMFG